MFLLSSDVVIAGTLCIVTVHLTTLSFHLIYEHILGAYDEGTLNQSEWSSVL